MNYRKIATFTGWLWIITFVTSISARFFFYAPVLDHKGNYVTGAGSDAHTLIAIGALLELLLIISNVGTAVVPYSIHKRVHEAGAVAYVTARLMECTFIAIGIVCMLGISTLRQDALSGTTAALASAVLFGATFLGVATVALATGAHLRTPRAVAILTTGYSVGQIAGPVLVTPMLHHSYQPALLAGAVIVAVAAVAALVLRYRFPHHLGPVPSRVRAAQ